MTFRMGKMERATVISVTITRDELVARDACSEGLELFDAWFPDGWRVEEWTPLHSLWLSVGETGLHATWLRDEGLVPRADLVGADLVGANLEGADLVGADLVGAILTLAVLRGADLAREDLTRAVLRGADLRGADLRGADLRGADLVGADLVGAILVGANLEGAILTDANRLPTDPPIPGWRVVDGRLER